MEVSRLTGWQKLRHMGSRLKKFVLGGMMKVETWFGGWAPQALASLAKSCRERRLQVAQGHEPGSFLAVQRTRDFLRDGEALRRM